MKTSLSFVWPFCTIQSCTHPFLVSERGVHRRRASRSAAWGRSQVEDWKAHRSLEPVSMLPALPPSHQPHVVNFCFTGDEWKPLRWSGKSQARPALPAVWPWTNHSPLTASVSQAVLGLCRGAGGLGLMMGLMIGPERGRVLSRSVSEGGARTGLWSS